MDIRIDKFDVFILECEVVYMFGIYLFSCVCVER